MGLKGNSTKPTGDHFLAETQQHLHFLILPGDNLTEIEQTDQNVVVGSQILEVPQVSKLSEGNVELKMTDQDALFEKHESPT